MIYIINIFPAHLIFIMMVHAMPMKSLFLSLLIFSLMSSKVCPVIWKLFPTGSLKKTSSYVSLGSYIFIINLKEFHVSVFIPKSYIKYIFNVILF